MIIQESFYLRLQSGESLFAPKELPHEMHASLPATVQICVDSCNRHQLPCSEIMFLGRAEEGGNWSEWMNVLNRRLSPNRLLMRSLWRTVGQCRSSKPTGTNASDGCEVLRKRNDLNQLATSEINPWRGWGRFTRYAEWNVSY